MYMERPASSRVFDCMKGAERKGQSMAPKKQAAKICIEKTVQCRDRLVSVCLGALKGRNAEQARMAPASLKAFQGKSGHAGPWTRASWVWGSWMSASRQRGTMKLARCRRQPLFEDVAGVLQRLAAGRLDALQERGVVLGEAGGPFWPLFQGRLEGFRRMCGTRDAVAFRGIA